MADLPWAEIADELAARGHATTGLVLDASTCREVASWYRDETRRHFGMALMFAQQAAAIPQPTQALFTQPWVYQFEAAAEVAICAYWLGHKQEALERFEALLPHVPAERRQWAESQIALCARELAR